MRASLQSFLGHAIDYAGLFPPARLDMASAVSGYRDSVTGSQGWIVDRFVCPTVRLMELIATLNVGEPMRVTCVGQAAEDGSDRRILEDLALVEEASATGAIQVEAYEAKIASAGALTGCLGALEALGDQMEGEGWPLFVELPLNESSIDAMHLAAARTDEIGFKARCGGTERSAFPSVRDLAAFIAEVSSLDVPFKFTAGLHEPLGHDDESLGVRHFGFLNVLGAATLAVGQDFGKVELEQALTADSPSLWSFSGEGAVFAGHSIGRDDISAFRSRFGGFGSCSIDEPITGLERLGLLVGVGA